MKGMFRFVAVLAVALSLVISTGLAKTTRSGPAFGTKYDPSITITAAVVQIEKDQWPEGDSWENNCFTRWVKEELGIVWKTKLVAPNQETLSQKISLALASGDLPDVIYLPKADLAKLANAGAVIPLNDLIDRYGSPALKAIIDEHFKVTRDLLFAPYTSKGKIYAIPHAVDELSVWAAGFIRQDLLVELGKSVPTTLTQLERIFAAAHAKYPDMTMYALDKDIGGIDTAMHPYGAYPTRWFKKGNKLVYGSIQPEVKKGLATLGKWYKNGWIDREFVVKDWIKAVIEPTAAGNVFSLRGPWWHVYWPFPDMLNNNPKAEMAVFPPLKGPGGKTLLVLPPNDYGWGMAINAKFKHPEALVYQLNEVVDSHNRNDETLRKLAKGYEFKYPRTAVQQQLNPEVPPEKSFLWRFNYEDPGWSFFNDGATHFNRSFGMFLFELPNQLIEQRFRIRDAYAKGTADKLSPRDKKDYDDIIKNPRFARTHFSTLDMIRQMQASKNLYFDPFVGAPTKTMVEKGAYLTKLEKETYVKIIMGELPVSAFDQFVKDWLKAGGEQVVAEVNAWYQDVQGK